MAAFVYLTVAGRSVEMGQPSEPLPENRREEEPSRPTFLSSHLAMLVTISTPLIGLWLLSSNSSPAELFPFRMATTLLTIFLLTLLLSIKQDLLTAGLIGSLSRLSETFTSINRFKSHLLQTEKLASSSRAAIWCSIGRWTTVFIMPAVFLTRPSFCHWSASYSLPLSGHPLILRKMQLQTAS
jgi:hypothetical protein